MRIRFLLAGIALLVPAAHAQTATVETLPVPFSARAIAPDGSAIAGTWTRHYMDVAVTGDVYHYYHHFPAVWVDGQVHLLDLPDLYTPNEDYEPVNTFVVAVSADADVIYGNARSSGTEPGGNPARPGVVRWGGVGGAMTFVEGLPYDSFVYAASPDGSVIAGYGPLSDEPLSESGAYRWEGGVRTELQGYHSDAHFTEILGVADDGRVFGARTASSEPYHTEAVWWESDGRLTVGEDVGPGSLKAVSSDGASWFRSARFYSSGTLPAERHRNGGVVELGNAEIWGPATLGTAVRWGHQSGSVSHDGSRVYARSSSFTPGSGTRYSTDLWVEGIGPAPILDVLAERYGVELPACPGGNPDFVWGVLSSDGRVLTVECPEYAWESQDLDEVAYRITLPATAAWAGDPSGFWDEPGRWAPAAVPDSAVATVIAAADAGHTVTLRRAEAAASLAVTADIGATSLPPVVLDLDGHTLTLGPAPDALVVGAADSGALGLDGGALVVDGSVVLGRLGEAQGILTVDGGHALTIEGGLTVADGGTDPTGSAVLVSDGSVTTAAGLILGAEPETSGLLSLSSGTQYQNTVRATSSVGSQGSGVVDVSGAFVSHTGPVVLGAFETGAGRIELANAASMLTTDSLVVGLRGAGELRVASGSGLSTGPVVLGDREGSVGSVVLTGAGSRWDVVGDLVVGGQGAAVLEVVDQAFICLGGVSHVGSQGRVVLDGTARIELVTDCAALSRAARSAASSGLLAAGLTIDGGGELAAEAVEVGAGGVVDGAGALSVPVTNGGTLAPGGDGALGTLALTAPLTQTAGGTLSVEVGASSADAVTVDGAVALGGTLRLAALAGEAPTVGQSHDVLTARSITGAFDRIEAPDGLVASVSATAVTVTVASAVDAEAGLARALALHAPSPNPTRGTAELGYELAEAAPVRLSVHDALGREVAVPVDGLRQPGAHAARLDASAWPSGVYLVRLAAGRELATRRLTVVR